MIQTLSKIIKKYHLDKKVLNNQAVTSVVSVMLVMMIFFGSIAIIFFWGLPAVNKSKINAQRESSFANLDLVDSAIDELLQDGVGGYQTVSIQSEENLGSIYIESESERFIAMHTRDNSYDLNVSGLDDNNESFKVEAYKDGSHIDVNNVTIYWMNETCFLSGTRVLMADGSYKNIENIKIGDSVKSYDVNTNYVADSKVTNVLCHSKDEMSNYYILINNFLRVTPNHKFFSDGKWVYANDLKPGNLLFTSEKNNFKISSIEKIFEKEKSFDLTVEKNHNYFVSLNKDIDVLVHNDEVDQSMTSYSNDLRFWGGTDEVILSQTFVPRAEQISKVKLNLRKINNPTAGVSCEIRQGTPTGSLITGVSVPSSSIDPSYSWVEFDFTDQSITPELTYCIVISSATDRTFGHYEYGYYDSSMSIDPYRDGYLSYYFRGSWFDEATWDGMFETYYPTAVNSPPDAPVNPSPVDSATGVSTSPTLSVDVGDPDGDSMDVRFYNASDDSVIGTDSGVPDGGTANVTWSDLGYDGVYVWYAVANDGTVVGDSSNTWRFRTESEPVVNNPPDKPTDPFPESDDTNIAIDGEISWTATDQDGNYATSAIYLSEPAIPGNVDSENENLNKLIEKIAIDDSDQNGSATSFDPGILEYNKKYFWKIIVWDSEGLSTEGPIWNFTTSEEEIIPPDQPLKPYVIGIYDYYYNDTTYNFETIALEDNLHYSWDFTGNKKSDTEWITVDGNKTSHSWSKSGLYIIRVKAKNVTTNAVSEWSEPLPLRIIEKNRKPENYKRMLSSKNGEITVHPPGSPQKIEINTVPTPEIKGTVMIELYNDSYPSGNPGVDSFAVIYVLDLGSMTQLIDSDLGEYNAILQNDGIYASKPNSFMWNNPFFVDYIKNTSMIHFIQIRNQDGKESVAGNGLFSFKISYLNLNILDNAERKACNLKMQVFGENKDLWITHLTNKNIFSKQTSSVDFPDTYCYQISDESNFVVKSSIINIELEKVT